MASDDHMIFPEDRESSQQGGVLSTPSVARRAFRSDGNPYRNISITNNK